MAQHGARGLRETAQLTNHMLVQWHSWQHYPRLNVSADLRQVRGRVSALSGPNQAQRSGSKSSLSLCITAVLLLSRPAAAASCNCNSSDMTLWPWYQPRSSNVSIPARASQPSLVAH